MLLHSASKRIGFFRGSVVVFCHGRLKLFQRLALLEEAKTLPMGAVYDYFNLKNNIPVGEAYLAEVEKYEQEILKVRN